MKTAVEINEANFEAEVLIAKGPVVVNFWAPWSLPCRILSQMFDEAAAECESDTKFIKVNVDEFPDLGGWYGIESIPTVLYFLNGSIAARIVGTASKDAILAKLKPLLAASPAVSMAH